MRRYFIPALTAIMTVAVPAQAEDTVSIDIYAIPSQPIVDAVAQASRDLGKRGMSTFFAQGQAAHVTLYLTRYPASAEPQLKAAVAKVAEGCKSFPLAIEGSERTASNWVFLSVVRSAALQRLADEITLAAEPFRAHDVTPPAWMREYPAKLPAFERYGSPNVFMQFEPHLTLLANETNPGLAAFMADLERNPPKATGKVAGIGIGVVDANGQILKTLSEYRCDS
ncbi:2'-5' RNA ligase family protein [Novosphingobium sp. BL-8H]|uniref:2'-5' RNA ligase family protein n=1 Tax=Novosphingobium sp. BL-8H TaxID=3127640 RepID=UPI0037571BE6